MADYGYALPAGALGVQKKLNTIHPKLGPLHLYTVSNTCNKVPIQYKKKKDSTRTVNSLMPLLNTQLINFGAVLLPSPAMHSVKVYRQTATDQENKMVMMVI